jgi:hypothetical protein
MPREVQPPVKKPGAKGKPLGIPTWGWIVGGVLGLVIGYMLVKRSGSSAAASGSDSGSSPLGSPDSGTGGGEPSPPPIPPTPSQIGGGNGDPISTPMEQDPTAPESQVFHGAPSIMPSQSVIQTATGSYQVPAATPGIAPTTISTSTGHGPQLTG